MASKSVPMETSYTSGTAAQLSWFLICPRLIASGGTTAPTVIATLVSGTSPDYDGLPSASTLSRRPQTEEPFLIQPVVTFAVMSSRPLEPPQLWTRPGSKHDLLMVINGDPGLPFTTIFDITNVIGHGTGTLTPQQLHCLPVNPNCSLSPGGGNNTPIGDGSAGDPNMFFPESTLLRPWPDLLRRCAREQYQHRGR